LEAVTRSPQGVRVLPRMSAGARRKKPGSCSIVRRQHADREQKGGVDGDPACRFAAFNTGELPAGSAQWNRANQGRTALRMYGDPNTGSSSWTACHPAQIRRSARRRPMMILEACSLGALGKEEQPLRRAMAENDVAVVSTPSPARVRRVWRSMVSQSEWLTMMDGDGGGIQTILSRIKKK